MGIALLAFVDLLAPLQSFACRWMPTRRSAADRSAGLRYVAVRPACTARTPTPAASGASNASVRNANERSDANSAPSVHRPLRVVRTVDAHQPSRRAGCVVLSGRLADVCAELDRLAALEAIELSRGSRVLH